MGYRDTIRHRERDSLFRVSRVSLNREWDSLQRKRQHHTPYRGGANAVQRQGNEGVITVR